MAFISVDYIYEVFSPAIRENTEDLYGQIQEFIRFSKESVSEWDYVKWNGSITRHNGVARVPRISRNHLNASSGIYRCEIKEVLNDTAYEDAMGFSYILFSLTAKRSAEGLQEKATELSCFLGEQVISWESYTWAQNVEDFNQSTAITREMFFYLHTDSGLYRCDIREVLESTNQADVGISGVSFFPALYPGERPSFEDEVYRRYCTWGRDNAGISIAY